MCTKFDIYVFIGKSFSLLVRFHLAQSYILLVLLEFGVYPTKTGNNHRTKRPKSQFAWYNIMYRNFGSFLEKIVTGPCGLSRLRFLVSLHYYFALRNKLFLHLTNYFLYSSVAEWFLSTLKSCFSITFLCILIVLCMSGQSWVSVWVNDCCLMPSEQFFCHIMARTC